jgi:hypothetical protein
MTWSAHGRFHFPQLLCMHAEQLTRKGKLPPDALWRCVSLIWSNMSHQAHVCISAASFLKQFLHRINGAWSLIVLLRPSRAPETRTKKYRRLPGEKRWLISAQVSPSAPFSLPLLLLGRSSLSCFHILVKTRFKEHGSVRSLSNSIMFN